MSEIRLTCPSDWTILGLSGSENGAALGFEKTKVRFERGQDGSATVDKMKRRMKEPHMSRVAGAFLLLVLLTSEGIASDPSAAPDDRGPGAASAALAVSVSETPDAVLLRIQASGDIEPGSVEVQLTDREAVVLARDAEGRRLRSQSLRLPELVVGQGASAAYDAEGALVMTFRKQATIRDAASQRDPEAAAR